MFLPRDALQSCDRMSSLRPSVRPSVTLVDFDHISWNPWNIISRCVSLGCSLSADPDIRRLLQREHPEILAQSDPPFCWFERRRHSIANCGRMVTDNATITKDRQPIGNLSNSRLRHRWPPTTSPFPKLGFHMPPRYDWLYRSNGWSDTH